VGAGEQLRTGREEHPVGRLQRRAGDLAAQHRDLVPEHQQFDVLGSLAA
jgi:hypothetical protein